jgi:hypothetical protein
MILRKMYPGQTRNNSCPKLIVCGKRHVMKTQSLLFPAGPNHRLSAYRRYVFMMLQKAAVQSEHTSGANCLCSLTCTRSARCALSVCIMHTDRHGGGTPRSRLDQSTPGIIDCPSPRSTPPLPCATRTVPVPGHPLFPPCDTSLVGLGLRQGECTLSGMAGAPPASSTGPSPAHMFRPSWSSKRLDKKPCASWSLELYCKVR